MPNSLKSLSNDSEAILKRILRIVYNYHIYMYKTYIYPYQSKNTQRGFKLQTIALTLCGLKSYIVRVHSNYCSKSLQSRDLYHLKLSNDSV